MNKPLPDEPDRRLLAGYADGELDGVTRARIERWLDANPDAIADLHDQEELSVHNDEYWQAVAPPMPTEREWRQTLGAITAAVDHPVPSHHWLGRAFAMTAAASVLIVAILALDRQRSSVPNLLEEMAVLPAILSDDSEDLIFRVATADDVELIQLPEAAADLVVVGRHPITDIPLLLAAAGDVQLLNYGPDDQGNLPDIDAAQGDDISLLWTPSGRP